jgi:cell wall-associated NlpC family hydrolase
MMMMKSTLQKKISVVLLTTLILFLTPLATTHAAVLLKLNSSGSTVVTLQQRLAALNYTITSVDGIFGQETRRAVISFQRDNKLEPTGVVDTTTWNTIKNNQMPRKKASQKPDPSLTPQVVMSKNANPTTAGIITTSRKYLGVPYKFGGITPKGFDCSGYLQYIFNENGMQIPRTADEQYKIGTSITQTQLQSGDLVFFTTYEKGASHCGLYLGDGKFIHASSSKGIHIDELNNSYWKPRYIGAKRIIN